VPAPMSIGGAPSHDCVTDAKSASVTQSPEGTAIRGSMSVRSGCECSSHNEMDVPWGGVVVNRRVGAMHDPVGLNAGDPTSVLDVSGIVRRLRRTSDLSQRDLARMVGIDQSQIARIEASHRGIDVQLFAQILEVGGMRPTIVDSRGVEITPVGHDVPRDNAGRRMPAHLDVLGPGELPYFALRGPRYDRAKPRARYHHRRARDQRRTEVGTGPSDDQPTRSDIAAIERAARSARLMEASRRASALLVDDCTCIPACWEHPGCAPSCVCRCGG